jgi:hypothetical protein
VETEVSLADNNNNDEKKKRSLREMFYALFGWETSVSGGSGEPHAPVKCGPDVHDHGNRVTMRHPPETGPTPEQVEAMVKAALKKGWTELYFYNRRGEPDPKMANHVGKILLNMGIPEDRLTCIGSEAAYQQRAAQRNNKLALN